MPCLLAEPIAMPVARLLMLVGLTLPLAALAYGLAGGDGRIELSLLALGVLIFVGGWALEKKRA